MTDALNTDNEAVPKVEKAPKAKKAAKPRAAKAKASKAVKAKAAKPSTKRRRKATDLIHVLTESRANPRRAGTDAHAHFEVMKKSKTVGAYLAQFAKGDERDVASQWLWNTVRDGWVELVPGEE